MELAWALLPLWVTEQSGDWKESRVWYGWLGDDDQLQEAERNKHK